MMSHFREAAKTWDTDEKFKMNRHFSQEINKEMGVKHLGFSLEELKQWSQDLGFNYFKHEIIFHMTKNERNYPLFLTAFRV